MYHLHHRETFLTKQLEQLERKYQSAELERDKVRDIIICDRYWIYLNGEVNKSNM